MRSVIACVGFLLLAGFVPVGSCAKGCGACARSGGDDVVRVGAHSADDFARTVPHSLPAPRVAMGATLANEGAVVSSHLDEALAALPEVEGPIAAFASAPSKRGASLTIVERLPGDDTGRSFASDYGRSIQKAGVSKDQHEKLVDAFDVAQEAAGQLVDAMGDDDDDKRKQVAAKLDRDLARALKPEQKEQLHALLGNSELIVHRLAKEQPVKR